MAERETHIGCEHMEPCKTPCLPRDEVMCDNCPFATSGRGAFLRRSLMPGRMAEIKRAVLNGAPFWCHKTTDQESWTEDGEQYIETGGERMCGGAIRFYRKSWAR